MLLQNSINWLVWRASSSYARAATVLASLGVMRAAVGWGCGGTDSVQAIPKGDFFLSPLPNASSFSFGMNFSKSTQAAQHLLLYVQLRYRLTSEFLLQIFIILFGAVLVHWGYVWNQNNNFDLTVVHQVWTQKEPGYGVEISAENLSPIWHKGGLKTSPLKVG